MVTPCNAREYPYIFLGRPLWVQSACFTTISRARTDLYDICREAIVVGNREKRRLCFSLYRTLRSKQNSVFLKYIISLDCFANKKVSLIQKTIKAICRTAFKSIWIWLPTAKQKICAVPKWRALLCCFNYPRQNELVCRGYLFCCKEWQLPTVKRTSLWAFPWCFKFQLPTVKRTWFLWSNSRLCIVSITYGKANVSCFEHLIYMK